MDRVTVYSGEIPRTVDFLQAEQNTMVAIGKVLDAVIGTGNAVAGLACTPNSPAALNVLLAGGQVFQVESLEATSWSALNPDTTDQIVKQGIQLAQQTISLTPPATPGFSQVFLIEVQYADLDTGSTVLPYFNAANPSSPFSGPGNSGTAQNATRKGTVAVQTKAGTAAATGTQTPPATDAGWIGLWYVTLANGQSTITAGNIVQVPGAPFIAMKLPQVPGAIQNGSPMVATSVTGTANAIVAAFNPAILSLVDGMRVRWRQPSTNGAGGVTLDVGTGTPHTVVQGDQSATVASVLLGGQWADATWDANNSVWQLFRAGEAYIANAVAPSAAVAPAVNAVDPGIPITNLVLSNDATTPNTDIDIAPGRVRDTTGAVDIVINSALIKRISVAWVPGGATAVGGLDTTPPVGNNKTVHVYALGRVNVSIASAARASNTATLSVPTHGLGVGTTIRVFGVGSGFDGIATVASVVDANTITYANTGSNVGTFAVPLGALNGFDAICSQNASAPSLPSGWTVYQCLGSILTDGSGNITAFVQYGDEFWLKTPIANLNTGTSGSTTVTVSTPAGVKTKAIINAGMGISSGATCLAYFSPLDISDQTAADNAVPGAHIGGTNNAETGSQVHIWTNTSSQIRLNIGVNSGAGGAVEIVTAGWRDPRRRMF